MSCLFYCFKKNYPENLNQNLLNNTDALSKSDKNKILKQVKFKLDLPKYKLDPILAPLKLEGVPKNRAS